MGETISRAQFQAIFHLLIVGMTNLSGAEGLFATLVGVMNGTAAACAYLMAVFEEGETP